MLKTKGKWTEFWPRLAHYAPCSLLLKVSYLTADFPRKSLLGGYTVLFSIVVEGTSVSENEQKIGLTGTKLRGETSGPVPATERPTGQLAAWLVEARWSSVGRLI